VPKLTKRERVPTETAKTIIAFIRRGNTITDAAVCAGIHRDTFYDWMKRGRKGEEGYTEFVEQVDMAVSQSIALCADAMRSLMASTNPMAAFKAAEFMLTRRGGPDWAPPKSSTVITGPAGGPVEFTAVTPERLAELRAMSDTDLKRVMNGAHPPEPPPKKKRLADKVLDA
jgi:hypothetical protein